nr:glycerol-3-phosphate acyltransferase 4-like [Penaeus vannamei]
MDHPSVLEPSRASSRRGRTRCPTWCGATSSSSCASWCKKGASEIDSVIYPIAIRFDPRYGDPFWYQDTFGQYILSMMTSWAIVCDVWYLPPTRRGPRESGAAFVSRVQGLIAHKGGFVQLAWDGSRPSRTQRIRHGEENKKNGNKRNRENMRDT